MQRGIWGGDGSDSGRKIERCSGNGLMLCPKDAALDSSLYGMVRGVLLPDAKPAQLCPHTTPPQAEVPP